MNIYLHLNFNLKSPSRSVLFFLLSQLQISLAQVDICSKLRFPESETTSLQFTKELSDTEYAVDSKFKSLHCCSKGYRSIEWFKDGKPYPWPVESSGFILYPESSNQTIYTRNLKPSDAGEYQCIVRDETTDIRHTTKLKVFDKCGYMEEPLWTHRPPAISNVSPGGQARVFCEAFVGYIDLPDAISEVVWEKVGNYSFVNSRISIKKIQREAGEIIGAYLIIENVHWSDFGVYTCAISNTGDQRILAETQLLPYSEKSSSLYFNKSSLIVILGVLFVLPLFASCLIRFFSRENKNFFTLMRQKLTKGSQFRKNKIKKSNDGLVLLYLAEDSNFVEKHLLPNLINNSSFEIIPRQFLREGVISKETRDILVKVGREVVLLTPNSLKVWNQTSLADALENLVILSQHCIIISEPLASNDLHFDFEMLANGRYRTVRWWTVGESNKSKVLNVLRVLTGNNQEPSSTVPITPLKDLKIVQPRRLNIFYKINLSKTTKEAHV